MTHKEKANQLIEKYGLISEFVVDAIVKELKILSFEVDIPKSDYEYWELVKKEIQQPQ